MAHLSISASVLILVGTGVVEQQGQHLGVILFFTCPVRENIRNQIWCWKDLLKMAIKFCFRFQNVCYMSLCIISYFLYKSIVSFSERSNATARTIWYFFLNCLVWSQNFLFYPLVKQGLTGRIIQFLVGFPMTLTTAQSQSFTNL